MAQRDRFTLLGRQTDCHVFEGDGTRPIAEEDVRVQYIPERVGFPEEIAGWRQAIEDHERREEAAGRPHRWNNPRFAVDRLVITRTDSEEAPVATLTLRDADYYDFLTTSINLDRVQRNGLTLREQYLESQDPVDAPPYMFCSFGVNVAVRTGPDRKMLFSHRSARVVGPNRSRWNSSANEGMAANHDIAPDGHISLHAVARRALREELAVQESDRVDLELLGFGLDLRNNQWAAFFGAVLGDLDEGRCAPGGPAVSRTSGSTTTSRSSPTTPTRSSRSSSTTPRSPGRRAPRPCSIWRSSAPRYRPGAATRRAAWTSRRPSAVSPGAMRRRRRADLGPVPTSPTPSVPPRSHPYRSE